MGELLPSACAHRRLRNAGLVRTRGKEAAAPSSKPGSRGSSLLSPGRIDTSFLPLFSLCERYLSSFSRRSFSQTPPPPPPVRPCWSVDPPDYKPPFPRLGAEHRKKKRKELYIMTTHNIVVFGGDHCGPEICSSPAVHREADGWLSRGDNLSTMRLRGEF
jgi:hypothetical protein